MITDRTRVVEASDELELVRVPGGTRVRLRVKAGARKNAILGVHCGALKVSVATAPERGKANLAVLRLLARRLDLPPSSLELVAGPTSPDKIVVIPLGSDRVAARLEAD